MRIARVLTRPNLGGPARQALASDPLLQSRGHAVRILTGRPEPGEGDLFDAFRRRGLDVVRVPGLRRGLGPLSDLRALGALRRELASFGPDVLHTHASKAGSLGRRAIRRVPGGERVGRVHTFHGHVLEGYFPRTLSRALVRHERRLARDTDRVVAVSHATAEDLVRLGVVEEERLVVVPPGIDLDALLEIPRPGLSRAGADPDRAPGALRWKVGGGGEPGEVWIGVVGRLAAVKRPERALEVFLEVWRAHPEARLAFVGDGAERRALERAVGRLGADGERRVHLFGAIEEMVGVWSDLDLVLNTSRAEGLPVALIEAAAAGLPAVAEAVGGVEEIVTHERTGWVGRGVAELAEGLARLLADPAERLAMGRRARLRVAERHGAARLAARLEELYTVVARERGGRR